MKYCTLYNNTSHIIDEIDEIIIYFDKNKILNLFTDFIPKHQSQRVIIELRDSYEENLEALKKISIIHKENPELKFDLLVNNFEQDFINLLKNSNIKYFFHTYVNNWDTFKGLIALGASDIYIVENMGFELDKISKIAHNNNIKIRVFPNVAQSSWNDTQDIYKFFIRPEDIDIYEKYVDVYEFYGNSKKTEIYYNIYKNNKKWFGNLKEIIIGMNSDLDSRYIIPRFADKRSRCGKECFKGGKCKICDRIIELSQSLKDANLIVKIDRKDKKRSEDSNGERTEE